MSRHLLHIAALSAALLTACPGLLRAQDAARAPIWRWASGRSNTSTRNTAVFAIWRWGSSTLQSFPRARRCSSCRCSPTCNFTRMPRRHSAKPGMRWSCSRTAEAATGFTRLVRRGPGLARLHRCGARPRPDPSNDRRRGVEVFRRQPDRASEVTCPTEPIRRAPAGGHRAGRAGSIRRPGPRTH